MVVALAVAVLGTSSMPALNFELVEMHETRINISCLQNS